MSHIPIVGDEVEVLSKELEKSCVYLIWENFMDEAEGKMHTNPRNGKVVKQFLNALDEDDKTKVYFQAAVIEEQELDDHGKVESLRVMIGRMHQYLEKIKEAESLLASVGMKKASGSHPKPEVKIKIISFPPTKSPSPYSRPRARTPSAFPTSQSSKSAKRPTCGYCERYGVDC
jgi:hypothetical protein